MTAMRDNREKTQRENRRREDGRSQLGKIDRILINIQKELRDSQKPASIENLTSYERKRIHSFFDDKADFETKTYKRNGKAVLKVFPVGNIKKMAKEKAEFVLESGEVYTFPFLPGYERFVIHNYLQDFNGIETKSVGEDRDRRLEIRPIRFGRSLKKIIKKIRLMK